jgi:hypothetical protein
MSYFGNAPRNKNGVGQEKRNSRNFHQPSVAALSPPTQGVPHPLLTPAYGSAGTMGPSSDRKNGQSRVFDPNYKKRETSLRQIYRMLELEAET